MDNIDSYEHKVIVRYVADKSAMNSQGFHAYVDSNKDLIIECAYWNAFDNTFDTLLKKHIYEAKGDVSLTGYFDEKVNVAEVLYSDFGAISNDGKDDFEALFLTHEYANQCGQKVLGDPDAVYNVGPAIPHYPTLLRSYGFKKITDQPFGIIVKTDVDFQGATFKINDKGSSAYNTRGNSLFLIASDYDPVVIDGQTRIQETFAEYTGGRDDIWYATNIEIYDYVKAYERLETSVDKTIVYNPSAIDVWFGHKNEIYCVKGGQTLYL